MELPDHRGHPLCSYFLKGYLSKHEDHTNFPPDQGLAIFDRYESLLRAALRALGCTKQDLRRRPEFDFDSGDPGNLESGIGVLRVAVALQRDFSEVSLVKPKKGARGADLACVRNGEKACVEVKTITKQSKSRSAPFYEDELYKKVFASSCGARSQLRSSAEELGCSVRILAFVLNWFEHYIFVGEAGYQAVVERLVADSSSGCIEGVNGVLFVDGGSFLFLIHPRGATD